MTSHTHPSLALRVGITGTRNLDTAHVDRLSVQLATVLQTAQHHMRQLARGDAAIGAAYQKPCRGQRPEPELRFISPLARGADRLAARAALALGYTLHVPMPFPQGEYERDFDTEDDLAEFRDLLSHANDGLMALDGAHGTAMNRSYEAVGRYVVRHSDFLIAIWDGGIGGGQGGTAEIVRYAALRGVPVWWLHADKALDPVWIADIQDLRDPETAPPPAELCLMDYVSGFVRPPRPCERLRHGIFGHLSHWRQPREMSPEADHFAEVPRKSRWLWQAYAWLMRRTSGQNVPGTPPRRPEDPVAGYWFDRYEPTDARAGDYARRYRSAYVWVFGFATLALIFGAAASMHPSGECWHEIMEYLSPPCIVLELIALLLIFVLVVVGMRREWHEHSIEYRLLAELYRKQQALAPLGWALPITTVRGMAAGDGPVPDRGAWVGWLFAAEQRAAPFPSGELTHAAKGEPRSAVLEELIAEQRTYHEERGKMAEAAGRFLEGWGERLFVLVGVCVLAKMALVWHFERVDLGLLFGFFAIILPGISAAFVGIRAYAELQLLAEESRHMAAELGRAHARVERLDPSRPLASQDLGGEAASVATLMLQDLQGWARLFRVKSMEAS